jgi:hypothetical protein
MSATNHGKRFSTIEIATALQWRYGNFSCIYRIIHCSTAIGWNWAYTKHTIFGVENNSMFLGN